MVIPAFASTTSFSSSWFSGMIGKMIFSGNPLGNHFGETGWAPCVSPQDAVTVFTGFFHAPGIPGPDAGEGALSESHSPGTPWTSFLETGRSTFLHRSPHETVQASLSRGSIQVTKPEENMRIIQENMRKPQNTQRPVHSNRLISGQCDDQQGLTDQGIFLCLNWHLSTDSWHAHWEHCFHKSSLYFLALHPANQKDSVQTSLRYILATCRVTHRIFYIERILFWQKKKRKEDKMHFFLNGSSVMYFAMNL